VAKEIILLVLRGHLSESRASLNVLYADFVLVFEALDELAMVTLRSQVVDRLVRHLTANHSPLGSLEDRFALLIIEWIRYVVFFRVIRGRAWGCLKLRPIVYLDSRSSCINFFI